MDETLLRRLHDMISPGAGTASLLGQLLGRGNFPGAINGSTQGDILNDPATLARINGYGAQSPNTRVAQGFDQFGPQPSNPQPMLPTPPTPAPVDIQPPAANAAGALSAQAQAMPPAAAQAVTTPMPAQRPPDAPQASPDMGFFARNAAMMRDPSSGAFIDPTNADRAQASGPDVIAKLLDMFHKKDT